MYGEPQWFQGGIDRMSAASLAFDGWSQGSGESASGSGIMTRLQGLCRPRPVRAQTSVRPPAASMDQEIALQERTDEALLAAHLSGADDSAFEMLLLRYADELVPFLTRLTGSRAAAEDVFQETFLQIHQSGGTFDMSRRFKPWMYTIAVNKGRDWHRRNARRKAMSLSAGMGSDDDGARIGDLLAADGPAPGSAMEDTERVSAVQKVVDEMPEHLREILLLSYFQRMSYNQIADALEIPLGTVKSRLHSAVAAFGRAWQQFQAGGKGEVN
ncbi:MAG: RNA polymerase subunit sigma-70 [Phycisphaerae bacterium]|nr:RNA polymerase subunit sigma-70 [Phycisphaerae bacterium]